MAAELETDVKATGTLAVWSVVTMNPGGPMVLLPVFAVLGVVRFVRLRTNAPDAPTRRALTAVIVAAGLAAVLAVVTFLPGRDPETPSQFATWAFLAGFLAWSVAMARWTAGLGVADSARRYRRAAAALAGALAIQVVTMASVAAFVDPGPARNRFVTMRPGHFLGRPLDGPISSAGVLLAAIALLAGFILLVLASSAFRSALERARRVADQSELGAATPS